MQYAATETLEKMQKSRRMLIENEEKGLREIWGMSIEEDKARKDFAVRSVCRISRTTLLALKSKGNPTSKKTEKQI